MPARRFVQVDVFTDTPFCGNPLAVILDGPGLTDEQMQAIAREMNLSETTFVLPPTEPRRACQSAHLYPTTGVAFRRTSGAGDQLRAGDGGFAPEPWGQV